MQVDVTFYETKQTPKNPIPRLVLSEEERRALRALAAGPGGIDGMMKSGLRVGRSTIEAALSGGRITKVSAERLRFAIRAASEPPAGKCPARPGLESCDHGLRLREWIATDKCQGTPGLIRKPGIFDSLWFGCCGWELVKGEESGKCLNT